jgi:hypothetical protein
VSARNAVHGPPHVDTPTTVAPRNHEHLAIRNARWRRRTGLTCRRHKKNRMSTPRPPGAPGAWARGAVPCTGRNVSCDCVFVVGQAGAQARGEARDATPDCRRRQHAGARALGSSLAQAHDQQEIGRDSLSRRRAQGAGAAWSRAALTALRRFRGRWMGKKMRLVG